MLKASPTRQLPLAALPGVRLSSLTQDTLQTLGHSGGGFKSANGLGLGSPITRAEKFCCLQKVQLGDGCSTGSD